MKTAAVVSSLPISGAWERRCFRSTYQRPYELMNIRGVNNLGFKSTRQAPPSANSFSVSRNVPRAAASGVYLGHAEYTEVCIPKIYSDPGFVSCAHCNCSGRCDIASYYMHTVIRCGILSIMVLALIAPCDQIRITGNPIARTKVQCIEIKVVQKIRGNVKRNRDVMIAFLEKLNVQS